MSFRNVFGVSGVREKAASIHTSDGGSFHGAVGLRVSTLTRVDLDISCALPCSHPFCATSIRLCALCANGRDLQE